MSIYDVAATERPECAVCGATFPTFRLRGAHERQSHSAGEISAQVRAERRAHSRLRWLERQPRSVLFLRYSNGDAVRHGREPLPIDTPLAEGPCVYCGGPQDGWDHVVPLHRGGAHDPSNLVPACWPCNKRKGHHTPLALVRWSLLCGWCWTPVTRRPASMVRSGRTEDAQPAFVTCSAAHRNMILGYQPLPFGHPSFPRTRHVAMAEAA